MKNLITLSLILTGGIVCCLLYAAAQTPDVAAPPPSNGRIRVVYHATPAEYEAYAFLVALNNEQSGLSMTTDTATFSTNSGFQVFMAPVFGSWQVTKAVAERQKAERDLNAVASRLKPDQLALLQSMARSMESIAATNPPPLPTNQPAAGQ